MNPFISKGVLCGLLLVSWGFSQGGKSISGWGDFKWGMDYKASLDLFAEEKYNWLVVKENLENTRAQNSIEVYKNDYLDFFLLQYDGQKSLYAIQIVIGRDYFNFYQTYLYFKQKYGAPQKVFYQKILWEDQKTTLELYRTGLVRYYRLDKKTQSPRESPQETSQTGIPEKTEPKALSQEEIFKSEMIKDKRFREIMELF